MGYFPEVLSKLFFQLLVLKNLINTFSQRSLSIHFLMERLAVHILPFTQQVLHQFFFLLQNLFSSFFLLTNFYFIVIIFQNVLGRYNKFSRTLCQTPWVIDGKKHMDSSIQEQICQHLEPFFNVQSKFNYSTLNQLYLR